LSNTTQFSRGCRVLRSGGQNHVNLCIHCVRRELTNKRIKAFPTEKNHRDAASLPRKGHLDGESLDTAHQRPELHDLSLPCAEHVIRIQNKAN
jgi:hypothetical protein